MYHFVRGKSSHFAYYLRVSNAPRFTTPAVWVPLRIQARTLNFSFFKNNFPQKYPQYNLRHCRQQQYWRWVLRHDVIANAKHSRLFLAAFLAARKQHRRTGGDTRVCGSGGRSLYPDPSWGIPTADFPVSPGLCNYDEHFDAHQIIFSLTFCVSPERLLYLPFTFARAQLKSPGPFPTG